MKAIEVKRGDEVVFNGILVTVTCLQLNSVEIESNGLKQSVSYSQIKKK